MAGADTVRVEAHARANRPWASGGVLAWVAMFSSILMWSEGNLRHGEIGNSHNYYRIVLVLLGAAAALFSLLRRGTLRRSFPGPLMLLLCYAAVAVFSSLYVPENSFYSMWKGLEVLVDVLAIAAVLSDFPPESSARIAYRLLATMYGLLMLVYLVEAVVMPEEALHSSRGYLPVQMLGVMPMMPENGLAFLSAITGFAAFCALQRTRGLFKRLFFALALVLSLVSLTLAQSRTSFIGFLAGVAVYLLFDRRYVQMLVMLIVFTTAALYTQATDVTRMYLVRGQDEELMKSFSGRTEGWEGAWAAFQESPIAGHGFAAFARTNILGAEGPSSLHGAVFDVMVGTGLLGLLPWACAILWNTGRLWVLRLRSHPWITSSQGRSFHAEMLGATVMMAFRAGTSSGLAMHDDNLMLLLAIVAYVASSRLIVSRREFNAGGARCRTG